MTRKLILIFFSVYTQMLISQVAVTYFPIQSFIAISSNTEKVIWADYKVETNSFPTNTNMELSPKFNFRRKEAVNYYLGPGISFNLANGVSNLGILNGYFLDVGTRLKPLNQHKNFQIVFEISPYISFDFKSGMLKTRLGLAWNFKKKEKN